MTTVFLPLRMVIVGIVSLRIIVELCVVFVKQQCKTMFPLRIISGSKYIPLRSQIDSVFPLRVGVVPLRMVYSW